MTLNLPLGFDNFKEIIDKKLDFVDKSLFIKEILDDDLPKWPLSPVPGVLVRRSIYPCCIIF